MRRFSDGYLTDTAQKYAKRFADQGVTLEIVNTTGAVDILARINAPGSNIEVAFVNGGLSDATRSPHLESLGSIAYDPLWVIYRTSLGQERRKWNGCVLLKRRVGH